MNQHPDTSDSSPAIARRRLLAAVLAGGAAAIPLAGAAAAEDSTTTTAPPRRDGSDTALLNGSLRLERGLVALYLAVYGRGDWADDEAAIVLAVHDHHKAYVDALVGYLGPEAASDAAPAVSAPAGSFAAVASQLAAAEERAVTAHLATIAALQGVDAAALLASVVSVEARHLAVMSIAGGEPISSATA